jgi:hypothetical protein
MSTIISIFNFTLDATPKQPSSSNLPSMKDSDSRDHKTDDRSDDRSDNRSDNKSDDKGYSHVSTKDFDRHT